MVRLVGGVLAALVVACADHEAAQTDENAAFPDEPLTTVSSDTGALRIAVRTAPSQPPPRGTCAVELHVTNASGAPTDDVSIDVVPLIPSHGHGTSVKPDVVAKGGGDFVVRNVNLYMPGDWELRFTFSGSVSDHAAATITVP
jgi:hypothetical protein